MRKAAFIGNNANFKKYLNAMRLWLELNVNTTHHWQNPTPMVLPRLEKKISVRGIVHVK